MGLNARPLQSALGFTIALALLGLAALPSVAQPAPHVVGAGAPLGRPHLSQGTEPASVPTLDDYADLTPLEVEAAQRTAALALAEAIRRGIDADGALLPAPSSAQEAPTARIAGAEAALAGWHRALAAEAWPARRAAVLALARVPLWSVGPPSPDSPYGAWLDSVGVLLADPHPSVVEAALEVAMRHGCFDRWAMADSLDSLRGLLDEPTPGVREALARAAGRFPAPVLVASGAVATQLPEGAELSATTRLRLELLNALMVDRDPAVRAEARAALLLADLPVGSAADDVELVASKAAWNERRIELVIDALAGSTALPEASVPANGAPESEPAPDFDPAEVIAYLELLARGSGDADLSARLVAAGPTLAAALAAETTSPPEIWHGLVQALVVLRGGTPDEEVLALGFWYWLVVRRSIDLELNSWRYVDQLFEHAIERPNVARGIALIEVGSAEFGGARVTDDVLSDFYAALRNGRSPLGLFEVFTSLGKLALAPASLARGLDRGVVAGDLAPLADWEGYANPSPILEEALERLLFEELARGHLDRPDAATEAELLKRLEARGFLARVGYDEPAFDAYAFELYEDAFRALCAARTSSGGALEPAGWASAERYFDVLGSSYGEVWRHSSGVRLDLLTRLPRVPELAAFADILILVGDTGGPRAAYRADCVELLGACRGVPRVQAALERWFEQEQPDAEGKVARTDELELAGLVRALAANGALLGRGQEQARRALELARTRGPLPDLARSSLSALARYPGGLAEGGETLLAGWRTADASDEKWAEVRADAALRVLGADAAWRAEHGDLVWDARAFLMGAVDVLESNQVERLADALATEDDATSFAFLCAELGERAAQHSVMVGVGPFVDALVERFASDDAARRARIAEVLVATARDAKQMEWRGLAYRGLAQVAALNAAVPSDEALALLVSVALGPEPEGFAALSDEEREFLRDQALFALAGTVRGLDRAQRVDLIARMARAAEPAVRAISDAHQLERWAGGEPRGGEFATQTAESVFAGLGSTSAQRTFLAAGDWHLSDPLFLRRLATIAGRGGDAQAGALEAELLELAWVAQGGRLPAEEDVAVELLARQLFGARERADWAAVGLLSDELAVRWRRTGIWQRTSNEAFWVGGLLGSYLPKEGREPQARVEAWRYQAAARVAAEPAPFTARAAECVGASRAARADL